MWVSSSSLLSSSASLRLFIPLGEHRSSTRQRHYDMNSQSIRPDRGKTSSKEVAQRALSQGNWSKALENFQKHCSQEPEDLRSQLKVAELLARLGRRQEAVQAYRPVGGGYAREGFLPE